MLSEPWWYWLVFLAAALVWGWFAYNVFRDLRLHRQRVERELWDEKYWPKVDR